MASTFTPNIQIEEPARGDDIGTWDTPVNSNMTLIDKVVGAITTIGLNNSPVVLSAAQFQSKTVTFNSTLTGSVVITFPTSFTKSYEIQNLCTGSSAFTVTLQTTAAGGQAIALPLGEFVDVINDGANLKFKNFGRVGSYWDYGGSSVPAWVTGCTVPPYLNCDGSTFSSATYPALAVILGSSILPDSRGRSRFALNQTTGRVTTAISGVDGNTRSASGGNENMQVHNHGITDPGHIHLNDAQKGTNNTATGGGAFPAINAAAATIQAAFTGIAINNAGAGGSQNMPPAYIGGLTLIRSA